MSNLDIKLLVLDIDGTLAGSSNEISESVKLAVEAVQQKNIPVALATGRMYRSALRFHQTIKSQLSMITYNGAWIQNPLTGEIQQHLPVSEQIALDLLEYFQSPPLSSYFGLHFYLEDCLYVKEITAATENYALRSQVEPIAVGDLRSILDKPPTKVLALAEKPYIIQELIAVLRERYTVNDLHLTQSSPDFLEAIHPRVNKAEAVKYLVENVLGIAKEQVMAIGDNFNDQEMLKYVGLGVAMGNAPTPVQDIADWIAPDVEQDGVAVAIEKFLL
jgi:Cof subfamily protein (haloacid dehalogenase superfamily)